MAPMLSGLIEQAKVCEAAGKWDEALAHYEAAFSRLGAEGDAAQAVELLRRIGTVHLQRSDLDLAAEIYETSLVIAEVNDLAADVAKALNCMGAIEQLRGELVGAQELYGRARGIAEALDDHRLAAMLDLNIGALANVRGEVALAVDSYSSALERYRGLGDDLSVARALNNLGMAYVDLEHFRMAQDHFDEAFSLAEASGNMLMVGTVELNRAELYLRTQQYEQARESCARSLETFNCLRAKTAIGEAYKLHGKLYRETGKPKEAGAHFAMALGLAEVGQDRLLQAEIQIDWALLYLEIGEHQEGITYLNRALRLFGELQATREVGDIRRKLERMEGLYLPAVREWSARMLGGVDDHEAAHAERVATHSCTLGDAVGMNGWDLTALRVGALVHDIGKTRVPVALDDEYRPAASAESRGLLHVHSIAGHALVRQLDFPLEVQAIVRHHHEAMAGIGYPDGLRGEEIPLGARIVCVADAFDALTHPRDAHTALAPHEAVEAMERDAGSRFDPALLALLRAAVLPERFVARAA